jgi:hypothetical protein
MPDPTGGGGAGVSFIAVAVGSIAALFVAALAEVVTKNDTTSAVLAAVAFVVGAILAGRKAYRTLAGK